MTSFRLIAKIILGGLLGCAASISFAQPADLPLKQISPNVFQIGSVRLDKEKRTVQFPATVNMTNGLVEYFVVNGTGKLHESILKTETDPSKIHMAMLFLGAKGMTNTSSTNVSGDKFAIEVRWKDGAAEKRLFAEDLILNSKAKVPMSKNGWVYNGSKVVNGTFIAQRDGSIVSIIGGALALANSVQTERDNDEIWFVNTNAIPPLNTKVDVTFKLEWPKKTTNDTK